MKVEDIAAVTHEANRALCETHGDFSQPMWGSAPEWQRESALKGVEFHLANPDATEAASHEEWMRHKEAEGWTYGPVKDPEKKQHPCMVPHHELPPEQQAKDRLFKAIVNALRPLVG